MKTKTKLTVLFISLLGFFVFFTLGYFYIRTKEQKLNQESLRNIAKQVISTVLEFKREGFLKPIKDNAAWDEMINFTNKRDVRWATEILKSILETHDMSYIGAFDNQGTALIEIDDTAGKGFSLASQDITKFFHGKTTIITFYNFDGKMYEVFGASIVPTSDTERKTAPHGYLICAKIWDENYRNEISKISGFEVTLVPVSDVNSDRNSSSIEEIYHELYDKDGNQLGFLRFHRQNQFKAELDNLGWFALAGSVILFLVALLFFFLTTRWVAKPLKSIAASLSEETDVPIEYLKEEHNEFGHIARLIILFRKQTADLLRKNSEHSQVNKALQESREFAEMIYKVTPSAIFTVDSNQRITSWNRKAEKITGFSANEMIGETCHAFADTPCHTKCGLFDAQISKPFHGKECTIRKKDGGVLIVTKNVDVLKDNLGNVIGGIESFEDITERKRIENDLVKAKEEAEVANTAKSEFLATMSHEIRTPMNGVIGMTELALTTNLTTSQRDYLQSIQTSAYLLLDTINDILDFSKIEAGRLEIEDVEFNIFEVVERSVEILTVKAFEKRIELLCEIEPGLPEHFMGDPLRIRQVLVNFISNAVKFTSGGEIFVSARCVQAPAAPNLPYLIKFSVKDTGIGIAEDKIGSIFDQFSQADNSTTRKYGGTGLGLSIAKKLTEMMGGNLELVSQPGVGSAFSFTIPLKKADGDEPSLKNPNKEIKKILVVDDNKTNLKIMADMLAYWGIEALTCESGNEAFEILEQAAADKHEFDLVILDMHMPDMDGVEVADTIRNRMLFKEYPFIFLHSSIDKDSIIQSRKELGVDHFLTKPVKMRDFYDLLMRGKPERKVPVPQQIINSSMQMHFDPSITIMIAEDNVINMKLLSVMLMKTGATIIQATDGNEAINKFSNNRIDLIFMDVHMPQTDGFQATKEIRKIEGTTRHTPIIALTAIALPGDRDKCIDAGMDDYLSKPFKKDDLITILGTYLSPVGN